VVARPFAPVGATCRLPVGGSTKRPPAQMELAMAALRLADAIYACDFQSGTVVLDLNADRYLLISGSLEEAMKVAISGGIPTRNQEVQIGKLVSRGILTAEPMPVTKDRAPAPRRGRRPTAALTGAPTRVWVVSAVVRMIATMYEVRKRPIREIIAELIEAKTRISTGGPRELDGLSRISGISTAARLIDFLFGANRWCLPRSICAMRMMMAAGYAPRMVIGVVDRPFQAHCWVEIGKFTVTDAPDRVSPFRPILTI